MVDALPSMDTWSFRGDGTAGRHLRNMDPVFMISSRKTTTILLTSMLYEILAISC